MKRCSTWIFLLLFISAKVSFAQQQESFWDKFYVGGNFGLQFGSQTYIDISPLFGYKLTEKLSTGLTATYIYYKFTDPNHYYPDYSSNTYGGSIFGRYAFAENFFAHAEFQELNYEVVEDFPNPNGTGYIFGEHRITVPFLFVGGGYLQRMGERSSFQIMLLYDLIQDRHSIYVNPIIRIGFGFGF